jgi:hypothetical protein
MTDLTINDNKIISTATGASSTVRGIIVTCAEDTLTGVQVSGNYINIVDDSAAEVGISFTGAGNPDKVTITDNNCLACTQAFLMSVAMTEIQIRNNQFVSYQDGLANVEQEDCNAVIANTSSGGTATSVLPASLPGLNYKFLKTVNQIFRVDPDGTDVIRGGGAGKYLQLDAAATASMVELECFVSGTWEITNAYGTISFEA